MLRFLIRIIGNSVALYVAYYLVPGFVVAAPMIHFLEAGLILALLNLIVRPILKLISLPLILLTLGLFTVVINMIILWLMTYLVTFIAFESLVALLLTTIIVSIVNVFFSSLAKLA